MKTDHTEYISIDDRDQSTIRAVILARSSDPGARPEDMASQVEQCAEFIREMGWMLAFPPYAFAESKTGMRNVERPMLDKVLKLAMGDEIDVIVCLRPARIDRRAGRRYQAIQTAMDYGVEFRFPKYAADRGKYPGGIAGLLEQFKDDLFDEQEARSITERLTPRKMGRFRDGLPHGGVTGPNYGYAPGERSAGKHGRPMGVLTWVIDEEKASWVRWMFDWVDAQPPAEVSLRGMARELDRRGVPTPSGGREWSASQVRSILRNPKYCGRGRNLRYWSEWDKKRDPETRMVRDVLLKHDRRNNPDEWENKTVPVAPDAIPAIVSPEQWERVQAKLKDAADLNNRGGPRRTDAEANSPLLDHGYIFCAECGGKMNRHWETKSNHPYYRCFKAGDRPSHPHIGFHVPAHAVDALTLRLLAKALTDPEKILEIASAAEEQLVEASADAELAASALAAYHKRLADITAEQDKLLAAIANLRGTTGTDTVVAGIQARLAQLNNDREEAENDHQHAIPLRDHAQSRAEFLRTMFAVRNRIVDFSTGETGDDGESHIRIGMPGIQMGDDGEPVRYSTLKLSHAAALLGVTEEELELPLTRGERFTFKKDDGSIGVDEAYDTVETADVVYCLLANMPRDRTRKLLHDLDAVVKVTRGRTRAEINAGVKKPPLADRVYLELLGTVQVRIDVKNLKISSYGCLCSFGPAPGGRSTQMKETLLSPCR